MSDSKKIEMGNVVVPPHHQSAPKEHWANKEIMAAAREIDEGKWMPDADPDRDAAMRSLNVALGLGNKGVAVGDAATDADFERTRMLDLIGRHPRVVEALEKMQQEQYAPADAVAAIERNLAMHQLAIESTKPQLWDGQGRWLGYENEEMRHGQVLTPQQFYDRLGKVTGKGKIKLGEAVIKESPIARSGRIGLFVRNPAYRGLPIIEGPTKHDQAIALRDSGQKLLNEAILLRKIGQNSAADKKVDLAGEMAQEAMRLMSEYSVEDAARPKEWLRVGVLQWPLGTEWMIMSFTEYGAVYKAKYLGWRTALLTMIRARVITEKEAHKAFPVPSGPAASWYLEQLAMIRNESGTVH